MSKNLTRTKLICTIGPASNNLETIKRMILNGMNVARLNFSHGSHESHRETIKLIRQAASDMGVHVGILQDLCGPKIRLGKLPDEGIMLTAGSQTILASSKEGLDDAIPVDYDNLHKEVMKGERILLADGMMELIVDEIKGPRVYCNVITGGVAYTRKGVNMPQTSLHVAAFSEKDRLDLAMGLQEKVDFVAMSFVRSGKDLEEIRSIIDASEHKPLLIAKIEKPQAVDNLDEILNLSGGVMVARGDLGVEMPLEETPHIQKVIIDKARKAGRITITATQMLASMVRSPRPTRSETTDVANAVLDGTDAVMLSDETANGEYPVEAVNMLARIAGSAESRINYIPDIDSSRFVNARSFTLAIGRAACWLAKDVGAKAIVTYSSTGYAPYCISRFRPECDLLVLTSNDYVCRQSTLLWGACAIKSDAMTEMDFIIEKAKSKVLEAGIAVPGDVIIITAGMPFAEIGTTSTLRIATV